MFNYIFCKFYTYVYFDDVYNIHANFKTIYFKSNIVKRIQNINYSIELEENKLSLQLTLKLEVFVCLASLNST